METAIELHLRIRVKPGGREAFLGFLRGAIPSYESPGGIRILLLEDTSDDHRFIEVVRYESQAAHDLDQVRVQSNPEMRRFLERWRDLLEGPPQVETYRVERV